MTSKKKNTVLLTPTSTVEVNVEESGIPIEPKKLFTKTPRQQLEGEPQDMVSVVEPFPSLEDRQLSC